MRKMFFMLTIAILAIATKAQEPVKVVDSTLVNDYKLQVINERVNGTNGIIATVSKLVSREKMNNDTILYLEPTQVFVNELSVAFNRFVQSFIETDSVLVDEIEVENEIKSIEDWQIKVLNDANIKNATTIGKWEKQNARLIKLKSFDRQIKKPKK